MNKLFQYDKRTCYDEETSHTWQFGIFKNRTLLWVNYENPTNQFWSSGGYFITLSFLSCSFFGLEFNNCEQCFSFHFFTEYFEGFGEEQN